MAVSFADLRSELPDLRPFSALVLECESLDFLILVEIQFQIESFLPVVVAALEVVFVLGSSVVAEYVVASDCAMLVVSVAHSAFPADFEFSVAEAVVDIAPTSAAGFAALLAVLAAAAAVLEYFAVV